MLHSIFSRFRNTILESDCLSYPASRAEALIPESQTFASMPISSRPTGRIYLVPRMPSLSNEARSNSNYPSTSEFIFGSLATIIGLGALYLAFLQLQRTRRVARYEMP
ncbi:hypothetical protein P171DRAFT_426762 [Karstenula rhodostoma CBS 690.94]|uniref:Uncharacterized protein n=1 Tax=Karstenula rhodostoma CBS 690.94 TaxID=1392251 RepID=A0A9P4UI82_9PLEO|nr:hypothetical protein P171DRAFT_426762 [Karstenula rhodostoma CBS 690.94]